MRRNKQGCSKCNDHRPPCPPCPPCPPPPVEPCPPGDTGCTLTQGFYKNHPEALPGMMSLGTMVYVQAQLLSILGEPVMGNGLISLAHQLIAAQANQTNGACTPISVQTAIDQANALVNGLVIPPIGTDFLNPATTSALTAILDQYNNGLTPGGPPHCLMTPGFV